MEEWKEYRLGDIATIKGGKRLPKGVNLIKAPNNHPYIRVQDLGHEKTLELNSSYAYVDDETQKFISKYIVNTGDIIMSIVGTIGLIGIVGNTLNNANLTENCVKVVNVSNIEKEYLYYFLISTYGQSEISKGIVGAVQLKLPIKNIQNISIKAPNLIIQKKISNILQSLDEKIELNRRINENLEQQAQALFKSWFVDFEPFKDGKFVDSELGMIPEGWKVIELQSMVTIKRGGSPRPIQEYLSKTGLRWLKISDATCNSSPFILEIKERIKESGLNKTVFLNKGELVLSNSATPGIPKFLGVDSCIHDGWLYFPVSSLSKEFLYLLFKEKRNELLSQGNGSVFLNLKTEIVKSLKIAICSKNTLEKFDDIIMPIFKKILELSLETDRLTKLRDILLPKLMSGEIKT